MTDEQWAMANNLAWNDPTMPHPKPLPLVARLQYIAKADTNTSVSRDADEAAQMLQNLYDVLRAVRNANGIDYGLPPQIAGLVNTAIVEMEGRL